MIVFSYLWFCIQSDDGYMQPKHAADCWLQVSCVGLWVCILFSIICVCKHNGDVLSRNYEKCLSSYYRWYDIMSNDVLRAGRTGVRTPAEARDVYLFQKSVPALGPLSIIFSGSHGTFRGMQWQCVKITTHLHTLPKLRMSAAVH